LDPYQLHGGEATIVGPKPRMALVQFPAIINSAGRHPGTGVRFLRLMVCVATGGRLGGLLRRKADRGLEVILDYAVLGTQKIVGPRQVTYSKVKDAAKRVICLTGVHWEGIALDLKTSKVGLVRVVGRVVDLSFTDTLDLNPSSPLIQDGAVAIG